MRYVSLATQTSLLVLASVQTSSAVTGGGPGEGIGLGVIGAVVLVIVVMAASGKK